MTTYQSNLDLRPQLRFASQNEQDELVRFKLRSAADELEVALHVLAMMPSGDALAKVVGLWTAGKRALERAGANTHLHTAKAPLEPVK